MDVLGLWKNMIILYLRVSNFVNLNETVRSFAELFPVMDFEKRYSDFYPEGYYYRYYSNYIEVQIAEADEDEYREYQVAIAISNINSDPVIFSIQIAEKLVLVGFCDHVAIPTSPRKGASKRLCMMQEETVNWVLQL